MRIEKTELFHIRMPLNFLFKTSQAAIQHRETIIIKITDELGNTGYGEAVAFNEPFYTNETLADSKNVLINEYIPGLIHKDVKHPFDIHNWFDLSYPMALAGLENALLDLYARRHKQSVMDVAFNEETNDEIFAGIVLGDQDASDLKKQIGHYLKEGYIRFKIKIKPEDGFAKLSAVRKSYPDILLLADANKSYKPEQIEEITEFDRLNLLCLEEPLDSTDFQAYQKLQKKMQTPVCLDESIETVDDLKTAIRLEALKAVNIKVGRAGGIYHARKMIGLCRENDIKYRIGSMLESGVSKMLHVHLASLKDTYIPGDLSSSKRYFEKDIINPEITVEKGMLKVPKGYGTGVEIEENVLRSFTIGYMRMGGENCEFDRGLEY
ncbi:MAG: o-succinylbenzoate synthase [Ruminiclostridium sp.]|nr:o-succinylbenzoate synthase [Ruminiclostridium sp.]